MERALSEDLERVASAHDEEDEERIIHITVQRSDGSGELALVVSAHHDALEELFFTLNAVGGHHCAEP